MRGDKSISGRFRSRNSGASNQAITPSVVGTLAFWVFGNNWGKTKKNQQFARKLGLKT